jgi:DNA-binding MarR family transcriptional regulator
MDRKEKLTQLLVEFHERFSSWEHGVIHETGLTLSRIHTLEMIGSLGAPRMKELAVRMGVTTGALTVLVNRLVESGYVQRRHDPDDRRSIRVMLTESGREHFSAHHDLHLQLTEEMIGELSEDEIKVFMNILERLIERF